MAGQFLEGILADSIKDHYCISYEKQKEYHEGMLASIVNDVQGSRVYDGRMPDGCTIERLNDIPMTCWDDIEKAVQEYGLDRTLLSKPVKYWQTSGYSNSPKRIYYGNADLERMYRYFLEILYVTGAFEHDAGMWNVGVADPYLPGTLYDDCFKKYGDKFKNRIKLASWPATDEQGFVNILKGISKVDNVNIMMTFPVMYYMIAMGVENPAWLEEKVVSTFSRLVFLPIPVLPRILSGALTRFYLRSIDYTHIRGIIETVRFGYVYGEHLDPYKKYVEERYPSIAFYNILGSTEMLLQAFQISDDHEEMSVPLKHYIPEIASPEDVAAAKSDPDRKLKAIPWYEWKKGMKGELIITRPGECLPLIRYPSGDYIEVMDPARMITVSRSGVDHHITLPTIRIMSRTMDLVDFDTPDQSGTFFGFKFYSKNLDDAMARVGNVKWWEFYKLHGSPGRYMIWVIPESQVKDVESYKKTIIGSLLKAPEDQAVSFSLAKELDVLDVIIAKPEAYGEIEKDIGRRVNEGRPLGRIKPRHIHKLDDEAEYDKILNKKKRQAV